MGRPPKSSSKAQSLRNDHYDGHKSTGGKKPKSRKVSLKINPPAKMTTFTRPPPTWPADLPYLSTVHLDKSLTSGQHALLHPEDLPGSDAYIVSSPCVFSPTLNPLVVIEAIKNPSHPAYPQSGLFAARQLAPGTHILDYTGLVHSCPLPTCSTSDYDLAFLDRDASLAVDGAGMGNEARFINDYHGIAEAPNTVFEEYYVKVKGAKGKEVWEARMGVWVNPLSNGIAKGEEICLSYGKGYWRARIGAMEQYEDDASESAEWKEEEVAEQTTSMAIEEGNE
ncbi:hypothetical protein H2200_007596 [Cladophialophora chaetospira]|uniref:SET domain-containing protein n=1 Tax=Cladophialophora chaetospira TaxID=386627 RepID=A0AA38X669_9EURO|nr:hypothetical protein H2200_007596 [Cladophialophora chaetospira]